jgi:uncharacterized protein
MLLLDEKTLLEELNSDECLRLIGTQVIGRIGFIVRGEPAVLPVNFASVGELIVFRTALGSAFDILIRDADVVFEVDHADPAYHSGWSVIARGTAQGLEGLMAETELDRLALRPWGLACPPGWIGISSARSPVDGSSKWRPAGASRQISEAGRTGSASGWLPPSSTKKVTRDL